MISSITAENISNSFVVGGVREDADLIPTSTRSSQAVEPRDGKDVTLFSKESTFAFPLTDSLEE